MYTGEAQWTDPRTSSSHLRGHGKTACKAHNYCCRNPWSVNKIAYRRSLLVDQPELYRGVNEVRGCGKRKAVERDENDLYSKRAKPCHTEIALEQQRRDDAKAATDEYNES